MSSPFISFQFQKMLWLHRKHIRIIFNFQTNLINIHFHARFYTSSTITPRSWFVCFNTSEASFLPFLNCHCYDKFPHLISSPGSYWASVDVPNEISIKAWTSFQAAGLFTSKFHDFQFSGGTNCAEMRRMRLSRPDFTSFSALMNWARGMKPEEKMHINCWGRLSSSTSSVIQKAEFYQIWIFILNFSCLSCLASLSFHIWLSAL